MASITIPAGGVDLQSNTVRPVLYTGGATITSGMCVYSDATDLDANGQGKVKATDPSSEASAECVGILLQDSASGEGAVVMGTGCVVKNPTFTKGTWYCCDASGAIVPYADLTASTDYVTYVGYGDEAGYLTVKIVITGTVKS